MELPADPGNTGRVQEQYSLMPDYTEKFYRDRHAATRASAERIVPLVLDLVPAQSIVDVGCGVGTWLSVFQDHGISDIQGYEGEWLVRQHLVVPQEWVAVCDLRQPILMTRKFDLAVSLEVAEHLPEECAASFISSLVQFAPVVLFSAAPPGQGGTHHTNERWPSYWIERFAEHRYVAIDCIREQIWDDESILWWYRQNTFLFVREDRLRTDSRLQRASQRTPRMPLTVIHPAHLLSKCNLMMKLRQDTPPVRESLRLLGRSLQAALRRRLPGHWGT